MSLSWKSIYELIVQPWFFCLVVGTKVENKSNSTISSESDEIQHDVGSKKPVEMKLLGLFSGWGAISTGLCLGANMSGVTLVTVCLNLMLLSCDERKQDLLLYG